METKLNYEELIITPELAKAILAVSENKNNRCINRANVITYARMMKEGKWMLDGDPITFNTENTLNEGHHRLHAVIEAGVPVTFSVLRNVPVKAFEVCGTGRARTASDVFKMKAIANYTNVSGIVRKFDMLNKGYNITGGSGTHGGNIIHVGNKFTNSDALEVYNQHPEEFQEFCCYAQCLRTHRHYYNICELGGIMAYLHISLGYEKETIYNFFNCLFQYKTNEEYALCAEVRNAITKAALDGYKLSGVYKQAILAIAWNNYASGNKKRKRLNVQLNTKPIAFE